MGMRIFANKNFQSLVR